MAGDGKGRLSTHLWDNGSLDLVAGPDGHLYAAWTEYEGNLWLSRSTDRGRSFSAPARVSGDRATPARGPSLAAGAGGVVHLAWAVGEDPASDIRVATSRDGGRSFGAPAIAHRSEGHSDAPKIAVEGDGTLHLVYGERPPDRPGGHVRYARRGAGDPAFAPPREISSPLPAGFRGAGFPSLSVEGRNVHVLWELFPEGMGRPVGLGFALSTDGGRTFSPPAVVPGTGVLGAGTNGSTQGLLTRKLAANASGAIAVVHSRFLRNRSSGVWLVRGRISRR
jgi:hypothetical protein